ncbi:MAG: DNA repair protein RecN [Woeseiaceae bacterium]|nr:DNA repair protein RecN [Woeseiaceae bacterium]
MLRSLQVRDFAIVDEIDVDFGPGMTVLTGETGAGKSILVDALGLVLGERGGAQLVRNGSRRAEFSADFDVAGLPAVGAWLEEQALDLDEDCLIRRVINADGRSRAFINGNAVTMQQLKSLGEMLLDIHGQHLHQSLGRRPVQRDLLDHFGALLDLRGETAAAFTHWQALRERLDRLQSDDADRASRIDLLTFQLQELDALAAEPGELESLQSERQKLRHSGALADAVSRALARLSDDDSANASAMLAEASRSLESVVDYDASIAPAIELIESAGIQLSEASEALQRYGETIDMDPARRDWVEERLDAFQVIARKHRVSADELPQVADSLRAEFEELSHAEERGAELEKEVAVARDDYFKLAGRLSIGRRKAAKAFASAVTDAMGGLGMPGGVFDIQLSQVAEDQARSWGTDDIEFRISANPGQAPMALSKVASGGELSRMSLAIQVIASDGSTIPTMVFDEVDSGVGGGVAEMVGRRLAELGEHRQVLCVTHLPQVASLAAQHFRISKVTDGKATRTGAHLLSHEERVEELARMLGGVDITQKTLDHAAEMLEGAGRKRA